MSLAQLQSFIGMLHTEGLIVAEMLPGTVPQSRHFPRRNRIISGLSLGTVVVEAVLDTAGRVLRGSARVVQSQNPVFNVEALRVVQAAVYRPARSGGRPAQVTIRQAVTFLNY